MSRNGDIVLMFGGEERTFRFGLAEHEALQEKLGLGVSLIAQNLFPFVSARDLTPTPTFEEIMGARRLGDIRVEQIAGVIFEGLVGGGTPPTDAAKLRKRWVYERGLLETAPIAYAICIAALVGPADEDSSSEPGGDATGPPSQTAKSGSETMASTPSEPPADSPRNRSAK